MQQFQTIAGIDISKLTLDICLLQNDTKKHYTIDNQPDAIRTLFSSLLTQVAPCNLYIGMENTGCYNYHLYQVLSELELTYYVIAPNHLKKSLGLSRGKNDKIDALRIAMFIDLNLKHLNAYKPQRAVITQLQSLLTIRGQRVKMRKQLAGGRDQYQYMSEDDCLLMSSLDNELVKDIDQQIKTIEAKIDELVSRDVRLHTYYKLMTSVQGVGKVLSWHLLVKTGEFNNITEPRKLACYAGIAPFEYRSGTSVRGKCKVSYLADKSLKTLFHLAALSAIRLEGDIRDYYLRKVEEGKNKMSVLNAVRNKIIHRIYAVLRKQKPYEKYLFKTLAMS